MLIKRFGYFGGRAGLGDDALPLLFPHVHDPFIDEPVIEWPGDADGFEADRRQDVTENLPVSVMTGQHDDALIALKEKAQRVVEILQLAIARPGIEPDQTGGEEHLDAEHDQGLHASAGNLIALPFAHVRKGPAEVSHRPLAMASIEAMKDGPNQLRRLEI